MAILLAPVVKGYLLPPVVTGLGPEGGAVGVGVGDGVVLVLGGAEVGGFSGFLDVVDLPGVPVALFSSILVIIGRRFITNCQGVFRVSLSILATPSSA